MYLSKKSLLVFGVLMLAALALAACATPEPETIIQEVEVTREVMVEGEEPAEPVAAEGECCDVYRVALFEDPVSTNYWNYLGPGSSVWTSYVVAGNSAALFALSDQRFDFVTSLAKDIPTPVQEGDVWTITVEMVDDAVWSDGESITAHDVVFTQNACADLALTQNWPNQCWPSVHSETEALDDYTVKFTYTEAPSLGTWQAGVALAPILPEHFWSASMTEARAFVDGVVAPEADCGAEDLGEADAAACTAYGEAFDNARKTLYEADATGQPVAGGFTTDQWEPGAFVQRTANDSYYFKGAVIKEYDDGTWILEHTNGTTYQLYGDAAGEEILNFTSGPYSPNIVFSIYGSQDAAFLALADGEVDYVINPLGLARGLREQAEKGEGIVTYTNADYGMFYLAFNMREYPQSLPGFRQAFDIIIDKEFVVNSVLAGVVFPMYSTMPPGNGFWYKDVDTPYVGLSREERVNEAVSVLKAEGWTWTQDPAWDEDLQDVVPGEGIRTPDGAAMSPMTILGPGPAYDPIRATFNQWISEWAREMGMPVESELTGFNTILDPVFISADFDMYILGWSLGNVAFPDYYESFWHSRNDTAVSGNYNTPGLNSDEYDALVDEFMSTSDLARAQELVYAMQDLLATERPYIPLFYKQVHDLARNTVEFPYTENLGGIESLQGMQTDAQVILSQ
jgi:ABC-type transport system substrate-binding protein